MISVGVVFVIALAALCLTTASKPMIRADAVKVVSYQAVPSDKPDVWKISVLFTNTTAKKVRLSFPSLQTRTNREWRELCGPYDPNRDYECGLAPHGSATQTVEFLTAVPRELWRLRATVCEQLQGPRRFMAATRWYLKGFTFDAFSGQTIHLSHPVTVLSDEFSGARKPD